MKDAEGPVVVIGAGLAGLACAVELQRAERPCLVLEASDRVGGRVATDRRDGFTLDRGFQVYLPAYPDARDLLDLQALSLAPFCRGALVRVGGRFVRVADPRHRPDHALQALAGGVFTLADALRVLGLLLKLGRGGSATIEPRETTADYLVRRGFSSRAIERFFRPFFGGVFLERELVTPAAMFELVFSMFAAGGAALPERGMDAIPKQLAARLPAGSVRRHAAVRHLDGSKVVLSDKESLKARHVVVATDRSSALSLTDHEGEARWHGASTLYYAAERSPLGEATLVLNGEASGPVDHLCVPSDVAASYAPAGAALISVSVRAGGSSDATAGDAVIDQLAAWFGPDVRRWKALARYDVPRALPRGCFSTAAETERKVRLERGLYLCGDHVATPSINGAIASGRAAARAVLAAAD